MTNTATCAPVQVRSLEQLLALERELRASIEADRRSLASLLYDLAMRLDGERLEAMRLEDPSVPEYWTAEDWRDFFEEIRAASAASPPALPSVLWGEKGGKQDEAVPNLPRRKGSLMPRPPAAPETAETVGDTRTARKSPSGQSKAPARRAVNLLAKYSEPPKPENVRLAGLLKGKRWRRGTMALYLIAMQGVNTMTEIDLSIVKVEPGLTTLRSNSVRSPLKELVDAEYLIANTLDVRKGDFTTNLKVFRLSEKGKAFCYKLGWDPVESDWERLITRHEGLRFPAHTAAVLLFTVHARRRGYAVAVVPDTDSPYAPDVRLTAGEETLDVEVELGTKERIAKWKNMAATQGFVALCAGTPQGRKRLVADCRAAGIRGKATDLQSLRDIPLETVAPDTPLWMEEFKP